MSNLDDFDRLFAQIKRAKCKLEIEFANAGIANFARFGKKLVVHLFDEALE